jgi:LuxR family maltose regulon positive regulatory protein
MLETAPALPFIASKLHPPRLTSTHVPRRRLVDRLDGHSDRPLTLVCAPAGSGKSTLLSEWLAATNRPGAWVSLDERDNELVGFVSYLIAAVKTINPMTTLETADMVNALPPPPLEVLAASLSNDFDQIDTDILLILDDYHVITNPQIDEFLFQLLRHPPRRLHLAVASRAEPSWPLATFRARG